MGGNRFTFKHFCGATFSNVVSTVSYFQRSMQNVLTTFIFLTRMKHVETYEMV